MSVLYIQVLTVLVYSEAYLNLTASGLALCLEQTGAWLIQVKLTKISYIGTSLKFGLYKISIYPGFGLYRFHGIQNLAFKVLINGFL